jgi:outer membrane protein assembly factor BamB
MIAAGCASVSNPQGWAPPTLVDETLYVSIEPGRMAALDAESLAVQWVFPPDTDEGNKLDLEGIYGAPVLHDGVIYFGANDGNVYALDAAEGFLIWPFETGDAIVNSLALKDGTLFAGSTDGVLYAINAASGDETDRFDTGSSIWGSPVVVEDVIYLPTMDGDLLALRADTLDPVEGFSFKTDAGLLMDPALANDNMLLVGGIDSTIYALNPGTGAELWSFGGGNWFWGRPLVTDNTAYVADMDGNVFALDLSDGAPLWPQPFTADDAVRSGPLLAGDTLVIVDSGGNAFGLNPEDGKPQWGPTLLGKTVLSDPLLLAQTIAPADTATPSSPDSGSPTPAPASPTPSPSPAAENGGREVVLIVAEGGDLCTIDPVDGSPVGALLCAEVPA